MTLAHLGQANNFYGSFLVLGNFLLALLMTTYNKNCDVKMAKNALK